MARTARMTTFPSHRIVPLALAATLFATPAHAGPTLAADLDLGTSVDTFKAASSPSNYLGVQVPPALYDVGLRIRAGWRFDLGHIFIVPEVGVGYDIERESSFSTSTTSDNVRARPHPRRRARGMVAPRPAGAPLRASDLRPPGVCPVHLAERGPERARERRRARARLPLPRALHGRRAPGLRRRDDLAPALGGHLPARPHIGLRQDHDGLRAPRVRTGAWKHGHRRRVAGLRGSGRRRVLVTVPLPVQSSLGERGTSPAHSQHTHLPLDEVRDDPTPSSASCSFVRARHRQRGHRVPRHHRDGGRRRCRRSRRRVDTRDHGRYDRRRDDDGHRRRREHVHPRFPRVQRRRRVLQRVVPGRHLRGSERVQRGWLRMHEGRRLL